MLSLHLPGEQVVCFSDEAADEELRQRLEGARSTLMAFFKYNAEYEDGRQ